VASTTSTASPRCQISRPSHVGPAADAADLVVAVEHALAGARRDVRARGAVLVEAEDGALGIGARPRRIEIELVLAVQRRQAVAAEVAGLQARVDVVGVHEQELLAVDAERLHRAVVRPVEVVALAIVAAAAAAIVGRPARRILRRLGRAAPARARLGLVERHRPPALGPYARELSR
jgi:hypothetical protein